jgi:hypothetical protein
MIAQFTEQLWVVLHHALEARGLGERGGAGLVLWVDELADRALLLLQNVQVLIVLSRDSVSSTGDNAVQRRDSREIRLT